MKIFFVSSIIFLSACQTSGPKDIDVPFDDWGTAKPGTVVSQSSEALKNGFYDVTKSSVNPAGHWEGVGHFGYIYFGKTEICRCSSFDTVTSPDGRYIVYHSNKNKRLELYNTRNKNISALSEGFVGYPRSARWDFKKLSVAIYLREPSGEMGKTLVASLE
ncbi:MAG: hypothetical protein ABJN22_10690 [Litorimonas sp.]